ncbi:hypothetical protein LSM04_005062 [Trypanosoma melophagium]|nr:hypothetical protein LSM04_005062 [Trypanosoma melophagium]
MGILTSSGPMTTSASSSSSLSLGGPVPSAIPTLSDSARLGNSVGGRLTGGGGGWAGAGSHSSEGFPLSSIGTRHHLARGAPLVRTGQRGGNGLRGQRGGPAVVTAGGGFLYPSDPISFSYYPGYMMNRVPQINPRTSVKRTTADAVASGFAQTSSKDISLKGSRSSQMQQNYWGVDQVSHPPCDGTNAIMNSANDVTAASNSVSQQQQQAVTYAYGY